MEPPRVVKLLALAEEFQALLKAGEVRNQADLACLKGLTRARVTQIMKLLKLAPEIQDYIRELPEEAPRNWVTEKKVRSLTGLGHEKQLREARSILHGFQPPTRQSA
jgi:hypothetical protein